jgi:uncharacterized membrane protein (UPF0182 family)
VPAGSRRVVVLDVEALMTRRRLVQALWLSVGAVIVLIVFLTLISGFLQKWLWMREVGYKAIFWRIWFIKWSLLIVSFACVFAYLAVNFRLVKGMPPSAMWTGVRRAGEVRELNRPPISPALWTLSYLVVSGFIALMFALFFYPEWDTYLRFHYGGSTGIADPIFHADVGFYLFRLPFYKLVQDSLVVLAFLTVVLISGAYVWAGAFRPDETRRLYVERRTVAHLSVLVAIFFFAWAWGYYLDRYDLMYSTEGVVYGVGYTAYHVTRICLWIMLLASIGLAVVTLLNIFLRKFIALVAAVTCYFLLYFVLLMILPGVVQKFRVVPSELELETPFLTHNIEFTRKAFALDRIEEKHYPALTDLTLDDISRDRETIDNIRLWDWRPLLQTYRQTQEIRLYYEFYNVDVGRYHLSDGYHQVMLSARELAEELPPKAQTWVNERLQFTHGYGLVMNFVSKQTGGGFPEYIIENIPPKSSYDLTVSRPAIYYGEKTPGYRIVATKIKEFDYPKGSENVYTSYQGKGGIPLDSFWKRLLFSWTQADINILLTSYLTPDSRIQLWRQVRERVSTIAPFLQLDGDPYLMLSEGKLYWIQDAYTTSDQYPYSEPYAGAWKQLNYIRNSVKAIVDIYEGSVSFYVMDPNDPVLKVYRRAWPGVFKDLNTLSPDLKKHLRYPENLFNIQADMYRTYHMTDVQVFYNQEDLWTFSNEKYAGTPVRLQPYYILMRLPGTKVLEYLLMTPFTPQKRDNMIAWMAAKCDFPEYGHILVYQLPKEKLILGPMQIEAMIDQNPLISEQLSLWDQRGSRVIRGNLVVIPIDNSFLYVEPVYLTAEGTNIPQLKRIIVISGDKVAMEPTLNQAIAAVFGKAAPKQPTVSVPAEENSLTLAREQLLKAQKALEQGQWAEFGKAMEELKKMLNAQPAKRTSPPK